MPITIHQISFRGLAGAIFVSLVLAIVLYVLGFATTAWSINGSLNQGLWQRCNSQSNDSMPDWFHAVQAMITIGLIGLVVSLILGGIYLLAFEVNRNQVIVGLVFSASISCVFMLIGFIIFGAKHDGDINWSYAVTVIGAILCALAAILAGIQMGKSGVTLIAVRYT